MSFIIDSHYKILMLGESQVGKTSLLIRYTDNDFKKSMLPTFGVDVRYKYITNNDNNIRLDLWDTAGQEKFRTITQNYYKGAHGILLVYDITNESTFSTLKNWMEDIRGNSEAEIVIIGNKLDLEKDRKVDKKTLESFADEYKLPFFETSALTGEGVEEAFNKLKDNLLLKKEKGVNESVDDGRDSKASSINLKQPNNNDNDNNNQRTNNCLC